MEKGRVSHLPSERMFASVRAMVRARFTMALPNDPQLLGRPATALQVQADPPNSLRPSGEAVVEFESCTSDLVLRCRVIQALEQAAGPDWQAIARPIE